MRWLGGQRPLAAACGSTDNQWALQSGVLSAGQKLLPIKIAKSVPTTLCVIGALTAAGLAFKDCNTCNDCDGCIEKTELGASLESFSGTLPTTALLLRQF